MLVLEKIKAIQNHNKDNLKIKIFRDQYISSEED